jgi:metal-responsive CopG/Arc/MetJ family transcriptional regulator
MRRVTNRTVKVSITIPLNIFNHLEAHLSYDQSRSGFISNAIEDKLADVHFTLEDFSRLEILEHLQYKYEKDSPEDVLIQALLALH